MQPLRPPQPWPSSVGLQSAPRFSSTFGHWRLDEFPDPIFAYFGGYKASLHYDLLYSKYILVVDHPKCEIKYISLVLIFVLFSVFSLFS